MAIEKHSGDRQGAPSEQRDAVRYVEQEEGHRVSEPFLTPESEQDTTIVSKLREEMADRAFLGGSHSGLVVDGRDVDFLSVAEFVEEDIDGEDTWCARIDLFEETQKWNGGWGLGSVSDLAKAESVAARIGHGCRVATISDDPAETSVSILIPVSAPDFKRPTDAEPTEWPCIEPPPEPQLQYREIGGMRGLTGSINVELRFALSGETSTSSQHDRDRRIDVLRDRFKRIADDSRKPGGLLKTIQLRREFEQLFGLRGEELQAWMERADTVLDELQGTESPCLSEENAAFAEDQLAPALQRITALPVQPPR